VIGAAHRVYTIATASSDSLAGANSTHFLAPGTYEVLAWASGYQDGAQDSVLIGNAQAVTGIDFILLP